jgi:hypothetical protein
MVPGPSVTNVDDAKLVSSIEAANRWVTAKPGLPAFVRSVFRIERTNVFGPIDTVATPPIPDYTGGIHLP